jgi:ribonucleoside-triphosphate reductase (thioredoxin)
MYLTVGARVLPRRAATVLRGRGTVLGLPRYAHLMFSTAAARVEEPEYLQPDSLYSMCSRSPAITTHGVGASAEQPLVHASAPGMLFQLDASFIAHWSTVKAPFGFNGLGELVYRRTYARFLNEDTDAKEEWFQTVQRVVNGTFSLQQEWAEQSELQWDAAERQRAAQEMYSRIFEMKFLPPGRGLWAMGSKLTTERRLYAALNNCAFVSTGEMSQEPSAPFCFLMDASMLGVGVGFDTKGAGTVTVRQPGSATARRSSSAVNGVNGASSSSSSSTSAVHYRVADSREGWVDSLRALLNAYFTGSALPQFDYTDVRPAGSPIRGFGGVSQGPEPLQVLHAEVVDSLQPLIGQPLSITAIVDIMNKIGKCVVAGNVRRTAEIAFGDPASDEYVALKDYAVNPQRASFGWTSNNSVMCPLGMDYTAVCKRVVQNGEPGFAWLHNMQNCGRMTGTEDQSDLSALGGNPCLEQTLESYEMCCLVETFPAKHASLEDYTATLRCAFEYAKTVTLGTTQWAATNEVMLRNRRIGCSMSGLAQFVAARGQHALREWCEEGYAAIQDADRALSKQLCIPTSIKTTSVKPSGTVSLLAGATPGMHYPEARFYIRRVRLAADSELLAPLAAAGLKIEPSVTDAGTAVVEIPVDAGEGVRTAQELTMWEQLLFAAFLQRHWADNQVSCTVTFDPETEGQKLPQALDYFQYHLKGVSFLPRVAAGAYAQMPYEAITAEQYAERMQGVSPVDFQQLAQQQPHSRDASATVEEVPDKFCDAAVCEPR